MDRKSLKRELQEAFDLRVGEAIDAVAQAPDGQWISASEWQVREAFQKLMADCFERILQAKVNDAKPSAFSPGGQSTRGQMQGQTRRQCADGRR